MAGISIGGALRLIGGVPIMPASAKTVIEKLRASKSMIPGDLGGMLSGVLQNGPGAILQNPIAAIQGQLQGAISGVTGKLQSMVSDIEGTIDSGARDLLNAVTGSGGLSGALGELTQASNLLSGLTTPGDGQFGLLDALGHVNIIGMLGDALPPGLGVDTIMKPLMVADRLAEMTTAVPAIVNSFVDGHIDASSAMAQVGSYTDEIRATLAASEAAFTTIQNAALPLAQTAAAISAIASGPPEMAPIVNMLIKDEHKAEIQQRMDEQIAPDPPVSV